MYMAEGWDTGDMIYKEEVKIEETDTMGILHDKLASIGAELLLKTLLAIERDLLQERNRITAKQVILERSTKILGPLTGRSRP